MDKKISLAVGVLKSALIVDPSYKNELIRNAIKVLDPEEYARMEKEFSDLLDEMSSGSNMTRKIDLMVPCISCGNSNIVTLPDTISARNWLKKNHICNKCMLIKRIKENIRSRVW